MQCVIYLLFLPVFVLEDEKEQAWNRHNLVEKVYNWLGGDGDGDGGGDGVPGHVLYYNNGRYSENSSVGRKTVGKISGSVIQGLAWQWRGDHMVDGFLYGRVDRRGRFTGSNITFIYPDLQTGK